MALRSIDHIESRGSEEAESSPKSKVSPSAVREQLRRIVSDPLFQHSKRLTDFLQYVVERTLEGRHEALKERMIGIEVFERSPDFDTSLDSIVRVSATELRKRLARYYEVPKHENELRIELPARSYLATFEPVPKISNSQSSKSHSSIFIHKRVFWMPSAVVLLAVTFWGGRHLLYPSPPIDEFWAPLLNSKGHVMIAIASPPSATPASGAPAATIVPTQSEASLAKFISQQANFPISEISAADSINAFLTGRGKQSVISLAQSTMLSELQGTPVVFLGGSLNPWVIRLGSNLHFRFQHDDVGRLNWIEDTSNPGNRSWEVNFRSPYNQVTSEYALITRDFDSSTGQWWIGIGGTTVLGTIGAEKIVTDPGAMAVLTAQLPKGWQRKNLQIVVEFKMVDGSLGASRVVATYLW